MTETVRAVNSLTARWADESGSDGTVFTAAGVWPLLGFLAAGAAGPARRELADALGVPAESAADRARELIAILTELRGVSTALGLWTRRDLELDPAWLAALPAHAHDRLIGDAVDDRKRLDHWAARCTDGLIPTMTVPTGQDTLLALAAALTVRTDWADPFQAASLRPESGPWAGREFTGLRRITGLRDQVALADAPGGPVTELRVAGTGGIDVHLLLGAPQMSAADVLATGVDLASGVQARIPADTLSPGDRSSAPGLTVSWATAAQPILSVATAAFTVTADHDLLAHPRLFGLATATDADSYGGHFPGISPTHPMAVGAARQSATACFGPLGFRAAAVTAVAVRLGGAARPTQRVREVHIRFDRPFGFLAVHRGSGLVLAAGWITEPDAWRPTAGRRTGQPAPLRPPIRFHPSPLTSRQPSASAPKPGPPGSGPVLG